MNPSLKLARIFAYISLLLLAPAWGDISKDGGIASAALAKTDLAKDTPKRADRLYAEAAMPPKAGPAGCEGASSLHAGPAKQ